MVIAISLEGLSPAAAIAADRGWPTPATSGEGVANVEDEEEVAILDPIHSTPLPVGVI